MRPRLSGASRPRPSSTALGAADRLHEARQLDRAGRVAEAMACYREAIEEAGRTGTWAVEAEALRRLAVLHHKAGEAAQAAEACERSVAIARARGDGALEAEAVNAQAAFALDHGDFDTARATFERALRIPGAQPDLKARVEGNLGILANVKGEFESAKEHYARALEGYRQAGHELGCAQAYHNLGMVSADQAQWLDADRYFDASLKTAEAIGDIHLGALCRLNRAEVHVGLQKYDEARREAEAALGVFDQLGSMLDKPDAYRVIGTVYRETGKPALAESRFRSAIDLAASLGSVLSQAEASRELALLYQAMGRNQDALSLLNAAHGLFRRLDARVDLVDVTGKVEKLEATFLAVVRDWGQSIESSDSYTFGHCERVASYAADVAAALGLDEAHVTTVRLGAYLHDVGKIRVPHEVLNKPGRLSDEEFEIIKMHPIWGVELLESVEFPWDIKPIIRWHHEKYDGTGYPDRLRGDEIPLPAMIIGIVDVYDALTTTRSYRPAMPRETALAEMARSRHWWRSDVYDAFCRAVGGAAAGGVAAADSRAA
jgi:putative nucleotidyltransferase with HDIG domain